MASIIIQGDEEDQKQQDACDIKQLNPSPPVDEAPAKLLKEDAEQKVKCQMCC